MLLRGSLKPGLSVLNLNLSVLPPELSVIPAQAGTQSPLLPARLRTNYDDQSSKQNTRENHKKQLWSHRPLEQACCPVRRTIRSNLPSVRSRWLNTAAASVFRDSAASGDRTGHAAEHPAGHPVLRTRWLPDHKAKMCGSANTLPHHPSGR